MMDNVERVARVLCDRRGYDPDALEPGDIAIQTDWDEETWSDGDSPGPDGTNRKGEPCHFRWRQFIFDAQAVLRDLGL